eukprot:TRINITY_DN49679_c0_g1_i7.p3 TRINITY_DN49679_c0_g1~~TRINITY_DN49679_c0_g1_i7.p3  ORF type:complete len:166 (-),score=7.57 TRINITY_DN49679_c0_g1_i7:1512-2009(-)
MQHISIKTQPRKSSQSEVRRVTKAKIPRAGKLILYTPPFHISTLCILYTPQYISHLNPVHFVQQHLTSCGYCVIAVQCGCIFALLANCIPPDLPLPTNYPLTLPFRHSPYQIQPKKNTDITFHYNHLRACSPRVCLQPCVFEYVKSSESNTSMLSIFWQMVSYYF